MGSDETGQIRAAQDQLRTEIAALLPDLRGFARFLVRDRALADDLVQDGVVRALGALGQFEAGTNLKAWLFTIVRNTFYEGARRRKRETIVMQEQSPGGTAERPEAEARAAVRDLQNLIWTLPPLLREALILVGAQEMTYEEAALVCAVPVGTIKARVSRGRIALAKAMRRTEGGSETVHTGADT
ncbi:MAG: sigma-70 family RNA polymerase sigma factor [Acetobacteraceae bacterium]|nr:sigma-70 family RNA polymerase sigma factor [Acetobacteraceae bacterium]